MNTPRYWLAALSFIVGLMWATEPDSKWGRRIGFGLAWVGVTIYARRDGTVK